MNPIPKSFSVRSLQRDYRTVIETAKNTGDAVLLLNKSAPEAVVLDIKTYNDLVRDDYAWDVPYTVKKVKKAVADYRAGKTKVLKNWNDLLR